MPFHHRFWNLLAVFSEAKMASKSIKEKIKSGFPSFSVSGIDFILIFDRFLNPTSIHWISKNYVFLKNEVFSKNRLSKITSISASILVPTCLHVGLQNLRFFEIMAFQEAFKIWSFFVSVFYRFWVRLGLQHGPILGAKTAQNPKKWVEKVGMVAFQERC